MWVKTGIARDVCGKEGRWDPRAEAAWLVGTYFGRARGNRATDEGMDVC